MCCLTELLTPEGDGNFEIKPTQIVLFLCVTDMLIFAKKKIQKWINKKKKIKKKHILSLSYVSQEAAKLVTIIELLPFNQARVKCRSRRNIVLHGNVFDLLEVHLIYTALKFYISLKWE